MGKVKPIMARSRVQRGSKRPIRACHAAGSRRLGSRQTACEQGGRLQTADACGLVRDRNRPSCPVPSVDRMTACAGTPNRAGPICAHSRGTALAARTSEPNLESFTYPIPEQFEQYEALLAAIIFCPCTRRQVTVQGDVGRGARRSSRGCSVARPVGAAVHSTTGPHRRRVGV